jgi:hypothetical protein
MEDDPSGQEDSGGTLNESLEALKQQAKTVEIALCEARLQMKGLQKKVSAEVVIQPRARTRQWLEKRGKPIHSEIEDFFELFLEEHAQEDRLDVSARTLQLNPEGQSLFGLGKEPIAMLDLLERLAKVYG